MLSYALAIAYTNPSLQRFLVKERFAVCSVFVLNMDCYRVKNQAAYFCGSKLG